MANPNQYCVIEKDNSSFLVYTADRKEDWIGDISSIRGIETVFNLNTCLLVDINPCYDIDKLIIDLIEASYRLPV